MIWKKLFKKEVDQFARLPTRRGAATTKPEQDSQLRFKGGKGEMLDKFSEYLEPQDEEELSAARLKLIQAGYRSSSAVQTMNFAKMVMGVGFLAVGVLYILVQPGEPTMASLLLTILIPGGVGYMLPSYWVERRLQQRQEDVTNGFPDALDLNIHRRLLYGICNPRLWNI